LPADNYYCIKDLENAFEKFGNSSLIIKRR
jgi:hypothetical protein